MTDSAAIQNVLAHLDKDQLVQDVIEMVNIRANGSEAAMGEYMAEKICADGIASLIAQEVEPGRPNVHRHLAPERAAGRLLQFDRRDVFHPAKKKNSRCAAARHQLPTARVGEADGEQWVFKQAAAT
ncbi:MAG: hypothetical protein U0Y68_23610 [Blastocatellia bacterium]